MTQDRAGAVETCLSPAPARTVRNGQPAGPAHRASERDCQTTIIEAARRTGWRVTAFRPARTSHGWRTPIQGDPGWPDLVLAHARTRRIMFVELKRKPYSLDDDQAAWGETLLACRCEWRVVYVPDELHSFCQELADLAAAL